MREYLVTVLLAAIITYLVTPLVKDLAVKAGAVSAIRSRDVHLEPTPRWGGLAMWLSMALTLVIVNYLPLVHKSFGPEATGIFLSGTLILLIGMVDDRFDLDPITKFAGQALAAGILLIYGVQILWLPTIDHKAFSSFWELLKLSLFEFFRLIKYRLPSLVAAGVLATLKSYESHQITMPW